MSLESHNREHTGIEGREGCRMERFIPDGIDRLLVKGVGVLTVMRGKVDGALQAINLGLSPWELLPGKLEPGDGESSESEGFLSGLGRFAKGPVGRIVQSVGLGCASAAGAAACGMQTDAGGGNNQPFTADSPEGMDPENPGPQFGTAKFAMTEGDLLNLGEPQAIPWSESGDSDPNISQMDGKQVITFERGSTQTDEGTIWYVECDDIEQCITEEAPQEIQGMQEAFQEFTNHEYPDVTTAYGTGVIYKDVNGQYKLYVEAGPELGGPVKLDIAHTEEGALKVSNLSIANPPLNPDSGLIINDVPYLLSNIGGNTNDILLNLHTNEQQPIDLGNAGTNMPHIDVNGGWAVGSLWMNPKEKYLLIAAPKLENLGKQLGDYIFLDKLNSWGGAINPILTNPRISGKVLIYFSQKGGIKLWYAIIQPYCGDGKPNGDETPQTCPKDFGINPGPDTVQPEPQPDTTTVLPDQDIVEETGGKIDAVTGVDTPLDTAILPETSAQPDTAEPKSDTPPVDTPPPKSDTVPPADASKPADTPNEDTPQDTAKPNPDADSETGKPETIPPKDIKPLEEDTVPLPPGKDTVQPKEDTENPALEPEEESGGSGGCSVTW